VSAAIAQRTPQIGAIIDDAEATAGDVRTFAARLPQFADTLEPGVENAAAVLAAVDPAAVGGIVSDASAVADWAAAQRPTLDAVLSDAGATADGARVVAEALAERVPQIERVIDRVEAVTADAEAFAAELPRFAEILRPGIENVSAVLQAVDPAAVRAVVDDAGAFASTLAAQGPQVAAIVDQVDAASADVRAVASAVRVELDTLTAALTDARAALADARAFAAELPELVETVRPGLANASEVLQSVEAEAISAIITDVRQVSATLAATRDDIENVVTTAGSAARRIDAVASTVADHREAIASTIEEVSAFASELGAVAPRVDAVVSGADRAFSTISDTVGAVDVEAVNAILANARAAAEAVGSRAGEIGTAIDQVAGAARDLAEGLGSVGGEDGLLRETLARARRIAANLEAASERVGGVVTRANELLGPPAQRLVANATEAAVAVGEVADAFASRADQIAGGLARFSQGGLDDFRALIDQGRSTLTTIERAVSSFDRNPSRVIFGGSNAPEYRPQRR